MPDKRNHDKPVARRKGRAKHRTKAQKEKDIERDAGADQAPRDAEEPMEGERVSTGDVDAIEEQVTQRISDDRGAQAHDRDDDRDDDRGADRGADEPTGND